MENKHYHSDEISLREILIKLREYAISIWRAKWTVILCMILAALLFAFLNMGKQANFPAKLSFMINEDDATTSVGLGGVLGQFGFGGGGSEFNLDKILELSRSRKITQNVIFRKETINGKNDFVANHMIQYLDSLQMWGKRKWHKEWFGPKEKLSLKGFSFTQDSIANFSRLENKALKRLHLHIIGNREAGIDPMLDTEYSETSGIMSLKMNTQKAKLSLSYVKGLFEELSKYYVDKTIEKQKYTYDILKEKTDSISGVLTYAQSSLAQFQDRNQNLISRQDRLKEQQFILEIQKLSVMYSEAEKNLQVADLSLKNKTPYIQLIDDPLLPIPPQKPSIFSGLVKGLVFGFLLSILFVLGRKIVRDSLQA